MGQVPVQASQDRRVARAYQPGIMGKVRPYPGRGSMGHRIGASRTSENLPSTHLGE